MYNYLGHPVVECLDCGQGLRLQVICSAGGWYVGRWCECSGPYSRESEYFEKRSMAAGYMNYLLNLSPSDAEA